MKKLLLLFVVFLFFFANTSKAQAFKSSNLNIDLGYVLGSHRGAFYSPGVMLSVEKGVHKWVGVGAYTGVQYNLPWLFYGGEHLSVPVGGFGSFHFYQMISDLVEKEIGSDKLDIAVKAALGARFDFADPLQTRFDWGVSINARYYLKENIGLYMELGNPAMGTIVFGLAVKM